MLGVGEKFPSFALAASVGIDQDSVKAFRIITDLDYAGKWKLYFFWPNDFTSLCPTELVGFSKMNQKFQERDTQILGGSLDSEWVHNAWRTHHPDLRKLPFPMLADTRRDLCGQLGILDPKSGVAQRATFLVDPDSTIRFVYVTEVSVGRNPDEVLRVLDALRTGALCPCNWNKGEETFTTA